MFWFAGRPRPTAAAAEPGRLRAVLPPRFVGRTGRHPFLLIALVWHMVTTVPRGAPRLSPGLDREDSRGAQTGVCARKPLRPHPSTTPPRGRSRWPTRTKPLARPALVFAETPHVRAVPSSFFMHVGWARHVSKQLFIWVILLGGFSSLASVRNSFYIWVSLLATQLLSRVLSTRRLPLPTEQVSFPERRDGATRPFRKQQKGNM